MTPEYYIERKTSLIVSFYPELHPQWHVRIVDKRQAEPAYATLEEQQANEEKVRRFPRLKILVPTHNTEICPIELFGIDEVDGKIINVVYKNRATGLWHWKGQGMDHMFVNKQAFILSLQKKTLTTEPFNKKIPKIIFNLVESAYPEKLVSEPAPQVTVNHAAEHQRAPNAREVEMVPDHPESREGSREFNSEFRREEPITNNPQESQAPDLKAIKEAITKRALRPFQNREKKRKLIAECQTLNENPEPKTLLSVLSVFNEHRYTPRHNHYLTRSLEPLVRDFAELQTPATLKLWLDGYIQYLRSLKKAGAVKLAYVEESTRAAWERFQNPQQDTSVLDMLHFKDPTNPQNLSILEAICYDRRTGKPDQNTAGLKALKAQFTSLPNDLDSSLVPLQTHGR